MLQMVLNAVVALMCFPVLTGQVQYFSSSAYRDGQSVEGVKWKREMDLGPADLLG